jgi:lipopolysaccharide/colanic/teichoic acid biosynthesis glycosyltransferase
MQEWMARPRLEAAGRQLEQQLCLPPLGGACKRAIDVAMAGAALLLLLPLMLAMAVIIRLLTRDSIVLSEHLIGRGGRTFVGYRFRVPGVNSTCSGRWTERVAGALRRSRLETLPQFFNVMRGDMSLIGPRARAAAEFGDDFAPAPECQLARPGLISLSETYGADLGGLRGEIALDRHYVKHWSLGLDFVLLRKTLFSMQRDGRTTQPRAV